MDSGDTNVHEAKDQLDNDTSATRGVNGNKKEATIERSHDSVQPTCLECVGGGACRL